MQSLLLLLLLLYRSNFVHVVNVLVVVVVVAASFHIGFVVHTKGANSITFFTPASRAR